MLTISLPEIGSTTQNSKDLIISILSKTFPLSSKKMFNLVRKQYNYAGTYQSIYKSIQQLCEECVLVRKKKEYMINQEWVAKTKKFLEEIEQNYANTTEIKEADAQGLHKTLNPEAQTLVFEKLRDLDKFYWNLVEDMKKRSAVLPEKERIFCIHAKHIYGALIDPEVHYGFIEGMKKAKIQVYVLCAGKTPLDKWVRDFYCKSRGSTFHIVLGMPWAFTTELWLFPYQAVEVYYSFDFQKIFDTIYTQTKNVGDVNFHQLFDSLYKNKDPVHVVTNRNKTIIDSLLKDTLANFKGV